MSNLITNIVRGLFFLSITLILASCDAPRHNPLDPDNPDAAFVSLRGSVKVTSQNGNPVSGARVIWRNEHKIRATDATGSYEFSKLIRRDGWLVFAKPGFLSDSVFVQWNNQTSVHRDVFLNQTPIPTISGVVQTATIPNTAIAGVHVLWKPAGQFTKTDNRGEFTLQLEQKQEGYLVFTKDGFQPDSVQVVWGSDHVEKTILLQAVVTTSISGFVKTQRIPNEPLENARITWLPDNQFTYSDERGAFLLEHLTTDPGWLVIEKQGFKTDSVWIAWDSQHVVEHIFLNAIPQVIALRMNSVVQHKYPNLRAFEIQLFAKITDTDGDVDSVYISNNALDIRAYLDYNANTKEYEKRFSTFDLNINSIREIVGLDFILKAVDRFDETFEIGTTQVKRVILDEIEFKGPSNGENTSATPTLEWRYFNPGFEFTFTAEIYTNEFTPVRVWRKTGIPSDSLSIMVDQSLNANNYFWVVWCVDEFDNRSRSKPASFQVR